MAVPQHLNRPPITEALVDFRFVADEPVTAARLVSLKEPLGRDFPKAEEQKALEAHFQVKEGKLLPPTARELGFQKLLLTSADATRMVQIRSDGFTYNNVGAYIGGDALLDDALRVWKLVAAAVRPTAVTRVALRYLNRLELPLKPGNLFDRYLTTPPELPDEAPQRISSFLSRIVAHDESGATTIVSHKLDAPTAPSPVSVIIDVDVFFSEETETDDDALRPFLESLRVLKNRVFFSLLTDDAVKLYL